MAFTVTVTAGKQFASDEPITNPKLNQLGSPTVTVTGSIDDLDNLNLTPTPATTGQGLYWDDANSELRVTDDVSDQRILGKYVTEMTGASSSTAGVRGTVPPPSAGDQINFLKGDGSWGQPTGSLGSVLYLVENFN